MTDEDYAREREEAALRVVAARMNASLGHREETLPGRKKQRMVIGEQGMCDMQYDVLRR